ncbi:HSF-type DNA-binding-domain-containing protein, partial [Pilobolus umbonatus]
MDYTQQYAERNYEDNSSLATNYPNYTIFSDRSNIMVQPSYNSSSLIMNENNAMEDGSRSLTVRSPTSWQDRHPRDISHKITHHANTSGRGIAGFVSKLYQCLQPNSKNQKYARWCEHDGKDMFIIDCIPEFTEVVLPGLFKHCKFPSFVRQLNIYGFQRDTDARKTKDTRDKESCRWYHPYFRPDRRDLFHLIRRKASRSKMAKQEDRDPDTIIYCQEDENEEEDIVQSDQSLTSDSHPLHEESDKGSTGQLTTFPHYSQDDQVAREQLHLQIYNMESQYERMQKQFDEQLRTSRKQIQEQQARIDHLECVLGMSKQN